MSAVTVWVLGFWYQCCGPSRQVGQQIELDLTLTGEMAITAEAQDSIVVLSEGRVDVTGTAVGLAGEEDDGDDERRGTLVPRAACGSACTAPFLRGRRFAASATCLTWSTESLMGIPRAC